MSIDDIYKLPVQDISADDCICFMWVTYPLLKEGIKTMEEWGFTYKSCAFSWTCDERSDVPHEKKAFRKSLDIAKRYLEEGQYIQVVGSNALFYHNTSVKPYWLSDVKKIKVVGNHIFYERIKK